MVLMGRSPRTDERHVWSRQSKNRWLFSQSTISYSQNKWAATKQHKNPVPKQS